MSNSLSNKKIQSCVETCPHKTKCFYNEISPNNLAEFENNSIEKLYKKNQFIFLQDNVPQGIYSICSGTAKLAITTDEGKEVIVRLVTVGDVIGHRAVFCSENHHLSAVAMEDSVIRFYPKEFIVTAIQKYPEIAIRLLQDLSQLIESSDTKCLELVHNNTRERFARLLLSLQNTHGKKEFDRVHLAIKISREEMAKLVGTSLESIVRLCTEFKNEGIIYQESKTLYIIDQDKLKNLANQ